MAKYGILNIETRTFKALEFNTYNQAMANVGLKSGSVDFGNIAENLSIIVYEYGLFRGSAGKYWTLFNRLFEGNAVIFQSDEMGETVDLEGENFILDNIKFFNNINEVESAIDRGEVVRPKTSINGNVIWQWPQDSLDFMNVEV